MPIFTFVRYDGLDSEIRQLITQLLAAPQLPPRSVPASDNAPFNPTPWDDVATGFESLVSAAVSDGRPG
jgi:hypothetical protein